MSPLPSFLFPDSNEPFDLTLQYTAELPLRRRKIEGIDLENRWLFPFPFLAEAGDLKVGREVGNRGEEEQGKKKRNRLGSFAAKRYDLKIGKDRIAVKYTRAVEEVR